MAQNLPGAAGPFAKRYPDIWEAYAALGKQASQAGPLDDKSRRLVKLALAIGGGSEGAVHSHARQALAEGLTADEIKQTALLAITTLGFPRAAAALTWIEDVTDPN